MMDPSTLGALTPSDRTYLAALYDAELYEIDKEIERLVSSLQETGDMEQTLLIIVGVHGEPLGEDPKLGYNNRLSDAELRVPVIVHWPARFTARTIERHSVETFPTAWKTVTSSGSSRPSTRMTSFLIANAPLYSLLLHRPSAPSHCLP